MKDSRVWFYGGIVSILLGLVSAAVDALMSALFLLMAALCLWIALMAKRKEDRENMKVGR